MTYNRKTTHNSRSPLWGLTWLNEVKFFSQSCAWLTVKCSEIPTAASGKTLLPMLENRKQNKNS